MARLGKNNTFVDVDCRVTGETEKAIRIALIPFGEPEEAEWFVPKSCLESFEDVETEKSTQMQTISIAEWFAKKEGLV